MKIHLLFFAILREKIGQAEGTYEVEAGETVGGLATRLFGFKESLLFAVNHQYVPCDYVIQEGDEVAFVPPVAGG
ncbi:MAG: MoaD/ThiS family protein [Deltaproteobacteria bacterium]|nr:MoaD/ThiS family protein [Deltaproteobacteria bacterium]